MKTRIIAAVVLASLVCSTVPAAAAAKTPDSAHSDQSLDHSPSPDHSCCPGLHSPLTLPTLVALMPVSEEPCGDRHPCCARQAPENPSALTSATRIERPEGQTQFASIDEEAVSSGASFLAKTSDKQSFPPYIVRSTVLRF